MPLLTSFATLSHRCDFSSRSTSGSPGARVFSRPKSGGDAVLRENAWVRGEAVIDPDVTTPACAIDPTTFSDLAATIPDFDHPVPVHPTVHGTVLRPSDAWPRIGSARRLSGDNEEHDGHGSESGNNGSHRATLYRWQRRGHAFGSGYPIHPAAIQNSRRGRLESIRLRRTRSRCNMT